MTINPPAEMNDAEAAEFRKWLFIGEDTGLPHPNDLVWESDDPSDLDPLSCVTEHSWIGGYRAGLKAAGREDPTVWNSALVRALGGGDQDVQRAMSFGALLFAAGATQTLVKAFAKVLASGRIGTDDLAGLNHNGIRIMFRADPTEETTYTEPNSENYKPNTPNDSGHR